MTRSSFPPTIVTVALAAALAWAWWPWTGKDMTLYLLPWFGHIRATGPIAAFAEPFSNYTPPYLYLLSATSLLGPWVDAATLIKLLSVAGTLSLVLAVRCLARAAGADAAMRRAALVLLLPSVLINAVVLAQCDAMWTAAAVMGVAAALQARHPAMIAWCGLALAIKLQAVFLAPWVLIVLLSRRVPFRWWLLAPAVLVAALLPAWLAGWPVMDLATIYWRQAGTFPALSAGAPNIWSLAQLSPGLGVVDLTGLAMLLSAGAVAGMLWWAIRTPLAGRRLVEAALLSALILPGLLPRIHERYFFLADVLGLAVAIIWGGRRAWWTAALVQTGSTLALFGYMSGSVAATSVGAMAMICATVLTAITLLGPPLDRHSPACPTRVGGLGRAGVGV